VVPFNLFAAVGIQFTKPAASACAQKVTDISASTWKKKGNKKKERKKERKKAKPNILIYT